MMPITTWREGFWWFVTAAVLGFGWSLGNWIGAKIFRK